MDLKKIKARSFEPRGSPENDTGRIATDASRPGFASSGPKVQLVFQPDLRSQIPNSTVWPLRCLAHLLIDVGGPAPEYATGWLLSPNVIVTAAHAVSYFDNSGTLQIARGVRAIPGRGGSTSAPFGVFDSTSIRVSEEWRRHPTTESDFGAILLNQPIGNQIGWFGCGIFTDEQIGDCNFSLIGYPTDKSPLGSMWGESGPAGSNPELLLYQMSSYAGQSGSPLFTVISGAAWVAAIHSGGQGTTNFGVRITQQIYEELMSWKS